MAYFLGFFIKATKTGAIFPMSYIEYDTYTCTPNQREEVKAYRDENTRELFRITASGMKTKITFSTRKTLHKADKVAILKFFTDEEALDVDDPITALKQRKVQLTYWNEEEDTYKTSYFYIPNMQFKVKHIYPTNKFDRNNNRIYDIVYEALDFELIEY